MRNCCTPWREGQPGYLLGRMEREHPEALHLGYTELEVGAGLWESRCVATVFTHQAHDWSAGG